MRTSSSTTRTTWLRYIVCFLLAAGLLVPSVSLQAHPSEAPDVTFPHVFAFEASYSEDDPDDYLRNGGELLLGELNCVACHTAPPEVMAHLEVAPGPDLSEIGSKFIFRDLWLIVRNPYFIRPGSTMPNMFAHMDDRRSQEYEEIAKFLFTQKAKVKKDYPEGDSDRGRETYHKVGCIACHNPATDFDPPNTRPGFPVDKPGIASVPIRFADLMNRDKLVEFLLNPSKHHPAGRMPAMGLSEKEAVDLAAYLQIEAILPATENPPISPEEIAFGKRLFSKWNCAACHDIKGEDLPPPPLATPLLKINPSIDRGCLAENPRLSTPFFRLSELQRKALHLAITNFQGGGASKPPTTEQRIERLFSAYNCYSCHERGGKGGPEITRAQYFDTKLPVPEIHKEFLTLPPSLSNVGHKLTSEWLNKILTEGDGYVRPYMHTRMPDYRTDAMGDLVEYLMQADKPTDPPNIETSDPSALSVDHGERLLSNKEGGLNCISCHGYAGNKQTGEVPSIDLSASKERLTPSYFKSLLKSPDELLPGSNMPPSFKERENADVEIEQIWRYLQTLESK